MFQGVGGLERSKGGFLRRSYGDHETLRRRILRRKKEGWKVKKRRER